MMSKIWIATALSVAGLLGQVERVGTSPAGTTEEGRAGGGQKESARLMGTAGFPAADGKSRFEDRGGEIRFRVEVEDTGLGAGTVLDVFVDGKLAGSMTMNALGDGSLHLNSDLGDATPAVFRGSTVEVRTVSGTVVVSGSY